ncbi:hypothetical protein [Gimesia panareensis]|uniref:Uncharacterized protein n=1 Tax=Gimesia panareensis TaxID=2527978 RepID=A0A518AAS4_9PLAN|nr:hypothetical protein [Gimesia panareensis]QDT28929.1 hypothetical protein Enr10x_42770 [Gimesia panareensis]QDU51775.1 hypothetical protein Pan110_41440 [Gimesia panareensis]
MARQEQDREDLMREATALYPRAELQVQHEIEPVFWGQKRSGQFSFYFGGDPVYQFDVQGHLRRAYLDGQLYRTQGATLARLKRTRTADSSTLERYDLTEAERAAVLNGMSDRFAKLLGQLEDPQAFQLTAFLADATEQELLVQIRAHINLVLQGATKLAPRIRGKR